MMSALRRNMGLKILAVFMSVFLWIFVRFTQTPFAEKVIQAEVQVPLEVVTDRNVMAVDPPRTVTVTVRGSKEAIDKLTGHSISARMDVTGKTDGLYMGHISVTKPSDVNIVDVEDQDRPIHLETKADKTFAVIVRVEGKPAAGYVAGTPTLQPTTVHVTGPRSYVTQQIARVVAPVPVNDLDISITERVQLTALDDENQRVPKVEIQPSTSLVTVPILPAIVPRLLPVFPTVEGHAPHGDTFHVTWSPRMVPAVLKQGARQGAAPSALYTEAIDVSKLKPGVHQIPAAIQAPGSLNLVRDRKVTVTVAIHKLKKKRK